MASQNSGIQLTKGTGDLEKVVLNHKGASAEVYLWGATLTSYKPASGKENIFVSPGAKFDGVKAIRGGVPVVFPQFGQPDKAMAQHGFARTSMWVVAGWNDKEDSAEVTFTLTESEATLAKWAHPFTLEYSVTLQESSLDLRLRVKNSGKTTFSFMALLHTYFEIPDIVHAGVRGLTGRTFLDKVDEGKEKVEDNEKIVLPAFTDRVYLGSDPASVKVTIESKDAAFADTACGAIICGEQKPVDVVVWNPYEVASPGDLPPPAFKNFICVEPGLVSKLHELPAGETAELSQTIYPTSS